MNRSAFNERATWPGLSTWPYRPLLEGCRPFGTHVVVSNNLEKLTIILADVAILGTDELNGISYHRVQHRLNIRRRAGDDTENLARRRLLLQRLGEIPVACIKFVEQTYVLDRD